MRDAGVTLFSTGMAFTFPIGLTLLFVPSWTYYERYVPDYYGGGYYITERVRNYAQTEAGLAFICMGPPITAAGIVMWAVGQYRMDMIRRINPNGFSLFENEKIQLNLAAGGNYMGLKLNF